MNGLVKAARFAHPIAAATVVALVFAQVYLIASFIFGAGGTALDAHRTIGGIVVGFELVVLLTAVVGWWREWDEVRISAALVLVGGLQVSFARDLGNSPHVHALHGALALVVVALAWTIAARTRREVFPTVAPAKG
jgi:hypothetical protein